MDKVKDLLKNFTGKLAAIQSKMKVLVNGSHFSMLSIIDFDGKVKDLNEWSSSFDRVVNLPQVASIFKGDIDEFFFNEFIVTLFKIETKMNRFIKEGKVIIDARCKIFFGELATIKTCEWPTKREVIVWKKLCK